MKLNIGCGARQYEGYTNLDICEPADIIHDLNNFPYPFKDNSIEFIRAEHVLEHLKDPELFFKEIHRILEKGGRIHIKVPHHSAEGAYSTIGHRSFFNEDAINNVCKVVGDNQLNKNRFKLIKKKVNCGRLLFWRKYEIEWVIEK